MTDKQIFFRGFLNCVESWSTTTGRPALERRNLLRARNRTAALTRTRSIPGRPV